MNARASDVFDEQSDIDARRRAMQAIFAGASLSTTAFLVATTVNPLVAEDLLGRASWSGVPAAVMVVGTAGGAAALSWQMQRTSRRTGMIVGYAGAAGASMLAGAAVERASFPIFLAAVFAVGAGYGANRLARYSAADLYPPERRAAAIGWIVWAATLGAIAGPSLLAPSQTVARHAGVNGLVGPYVLGGLAMAAAALVMLAMPSSVERTRVRAAGSTMPPRWRTLVAGRPAIALVAMTAAQTTMVLVMSMTPVHMRHDGRELSAIGVVIAVHTVGMYALSPITGWLTTRIGPVTTALAGCGTLLCACLLAALAGMGRPQWILAALGLLGVGWNGAFVAGSALLTEPADPGARLRLQGLGDTLVWTVGAIAGLASGIVLEQYGFFVLAIIGAVIAGIPFVSLVTSRGAGMPPGHAVPVPPGR